MPRIHVSGGSSDTRSGEIAFSEVRTFVHLRSGCVVMSSGSEAADGRKRLDGPPTDQVHAIGLPTSENRTAFSNTFSGPQIPPMTPA